MPDGLSALRCAAAVRIVLLAAGLSCLLAGGCRVGGAVESAADLAGEYVRPHRVFVFHGDEPVEVDVADRVRLGSAQGGGLSFELHLIAPSGSECRFAGRAEPGAGEYEYLGGEGRNRCRLSIRSTPEAIVVADSGCGELHCQAPAAIGRLIFPRRSPS